MWNWLRKKKHPLSQAETLPSLTIRRFEVKEQKDGNGYYQVFAELPNHLTLALGYTKDKEKKEDLFSHGTKTIQEFFLHYGPNLGLIVEGLPHLTTEEQQAIEEAFRGRTFDGFSLQRGEYLEIGALPWKISHEEESLKYFLDELHTYLPETVEEHLFQYGMTEENSKECMLGEEEHPASWALRLHILCTQITVQAIQIALLHKHLQKK